MNDTEFKLKSANDSQQLGNKSEEMEVSEEEHQECKSGGEEGLKDMKADDDLTEAEIGFQLESKSLDAVSVTSAVLNSVFPPGEEGNNGGLPTMEVVGLPNPGDNGKKGKFKAKLSAAEKRRLNFLMQDGRTKEEALLLLRNPGGKAGAPQTPKRQRSSDLTSPGNNLGHKPKRVRDRTMVPRSDTRRQHAGPGISYKEMAEATVIAVVPDGYPGARLSTENLAAVREAILDCIATADQSSAVRPCFRSCSFRYGYLEIACADAETVSWLKTAVESVRPWENASLKALELEQLPKLFPMVGYFPDSKKTVNERILRMVQNQNYGICTETWRVVNRKETPTTSTVELLLHVDGASANGIEAANMMLNYKFGKARLRKVKERQTIPEGGESAGVSGQPILQHPSAGSVPPASTGVGHVPPTLSTGRVPSTARPSSGHQPPVQSSSVDVGTVPPGRRAASRQQPPANRGKQRKAGRGGSNSVAKRLQPNSAGNTASNGDSAAGSRQPDATTPAGQAEDGTTQQQ